MCQLNATIFHYFRKVSSKIFCYINNDVHSEKSSCWDSLSPCSVLVYVGPEEGLAVLGHAAD